MASLSVRATIVREMLEERFREISSPLAHRDPFQLLVATVLSARCTDERVNKITGVLFAEAPTAEALAGLPPDRLEAIVHPAGFFRQKSRALRGLSERIVRDFHGQVPLNFPDLESLPGVGHKTASVVLGQCTAIPTFPVDTHVHRLASRWGLSSGANVETTERDLKALFPPDSWMDLHLRMIAYGRSECTARGCDGGRCPICRRLAEEKMP